MTRPAAPSHRRRGAGGAAGGSIVAALVFNASIIMLPFAGASLIRSLSAGDLIDFTPSPKTIQSTRAALANEAGRFAPRGSAARREEWNNLIAREMAENDVAAARGFALSAPALLGPGDAAKILRQIKPGAGDAGQLEATLPLIEPVFARQRFRAVMNMSERGSFDVLGDAREIATTAQRWIGGEPVDLFLFTLGGATLTSAGIDPQRDDVRLGASVIKIAKNNAKLSPQFTAMIEQELAAAVPTETLRAELTGAFQNRDAIVDEGAAATLAFSRAINRDAYAVLTSDLAHIGAAARAASPAGAAQLLTHVRDRRDLRRLELLAVATGERAVAVAKRSPSGLVLNAARGAIRWREQLVQDIMSVALAALGVIIATHIALMTALRREWEGGGAPRSGSAPISKADAQRLAQEKPAPLKMDARV